MKPRDEAGEASGGSKFVAMGDTGKEKVVPKTSFREALINVPGVTGDEEEEIPAVWENEILPEDRWYLESDEEQSLNHDSAGKTPVIPVSDDEIKDWSKPWKLTLIVNVMDKKLNFRVLESKINRDWARTGKVKIIDLPRGYYAVQFDKEEDYQQVLFKGPWMVADHYLLVQRWRPNFLNIAKREKRVAVWIKVPELALELYNLKFLTRLGNTLGLFLKMDSLTTFQSRGQFARICVELNLAKPLIPFVEVRGEKVKLEYEGLHAVCFRCGIYGHKVEACTAMKSHKVPTVGEGGAEVVQGGAKGGHDNVKEGITQTVARKEVGPEVSGATIECSTFPTAEVGVPGREDTVSTVSRDVNLEEDSDQGIFGPWMLAQRKGKRKVKGQALSKGIKKNSVEKKKKGWSGEGSRFDALEGSQEILLELGHAGVNGQAEQVSNVSGPEGIKPVTSKHGPVNQSKASSTSGDKKSSLGPRLRDAKKEARSSRALKKAFQFPHEPGVLVGKENVRPKVNPLVKVFVKRGGKPPDTQGHVILDRGKKDDVVAMEGVEEELTSQRSKGGNHHGENGDKASIVSIEMAIPSGSIVGTGCKQPSEVLSEQKTPKLSL